MRQPDINRIARASEHIKAAIVSLESIKWEHLEGRNYLDHREILDELRAVKHMIDNWHLALKEGRQ